MKTEEIQEALKDPNATINELTITISNTQENGSEVTEDGFAISKDTVLALYNKAKEANAKDISMTFKDCRSLGNATVTISVKMPLTEEEKKEQEEIKTKALEQEQKIGPHYCPEWDHMWLDAGFPEFSCCTCESPERVFNDGDPL